MMVEANLQGVLRLYRAALLRCWLPSLLLAGLWAWQGMRLERALGPIDDLLQWSAQLQALMWSGYLWRMLALGGALSVLLYTAMVADIHAVAVGAAAPAAAGLVAALGAWPSALLAAIIFVTGTSMATMLFVVPGAYLWGMWQLWLVVLAVEHTGPRVALRRSWQLMTGCWWRITTLVTIVTLISVVPPMVISSLLDVLLMVVGVDLAHAPAIMTVAGAILNALLLPLVPAALVAAYLARQRETALPAQS